jgi:hypothetical protein
MSCPPGLYFCSEKQICDWIWDPECKYDCNIVKSKPVVIVEEKFIPAAVPTCPPQTVGVVTYLPNPDDCNMYYECSNGVAVPMRCPDLLYFCTQKNSCDWIWDSECTFNCNMGSKETPAAVYDSGVTANGINHRNAILGTNGKIVSL